MAVCAYCQVKSDRPCAYTARTREYYRALITALRHVARRNGYALATHGSVKSDIDLIAVPWRDTAVSPDYLVNALRLAVEQIIGHAEFGPGQQPEQKPCGRLAWSLYLQPTEIPGPYIDLSVMPVVVDGRVR